MGLINSIRLFNSESGSHLSGPGSFDQLVEICAPMIRAIKEGRLVTHSGLTMLDELYCELVKRGEIDPIGNLGEPDRKRLWLAAKKTGLQDRNRLIQISRSIYVSEKI